MIILQIIQTLMAVIAAGLGFYCALGIYNNKLDARSKKAKVCLTAGFICLIISFILLLIIKA